MGYNGVDISADVTSQVTSHHFKYSPPPTFIKSPKGTVEVDTSLPFPNCNLIRTECRLCHHSTERTIARTLATFPSETMHQSRVEQLLSHFDKMYLGFCYYVSRQAGICTGGSGNTLAPRTAASSGNRVVFGRPGSACGNQYIRGVWTSRACLYFRCFRPGAVLTS